MEPDFGAFVVIVAIAFGILFLGGLDWRLFARPRDAAAARARRDPVAAPYRLQRLTAFLDPWSDPLRQGLPALAFADRVRPRRVASASAWASSVEKLLYLPEAHTDFLLAVIAEELGLRRRRAS